MAYTTLGSLNWGSSPRIPLTFYYDSQRNGLDMQYKIKIVVGAVTGASYFGYPIYTTLSMDGTAKVSGYTIKTASPSQWSSEITYESDWLTVSNKTDGSTALTIRMYSGSGSSRSNTYDYSLMVLPAATTPTLSVTTADMGASVTISMSGRASSDYTHNLSYAFGALTGQTAGLSASTGVATSATFTPPVALAAQIPNAVSGLCTITCETYNGTTLIGTRTVTLTLTVPESVVPTISSVSITEATAGLATQFQAYVQNKSTLAVAITASGTYGSTIAKYETLILGIKYTEASFTSEPLSRAGSNIPVVMMVTDSRGRTATATRTLTVREYFPPKINGMSSYRINTSGTADPTGARVAVTMDFAIAEVGTRNLRTYALQYKKTTDQSFTTFASGTASWVYSGTQNFTSTPAIDPDYPYIIRLTLTDYFGSVTADYEIPTGFALVDFRSTGKGMALGKVSEKDALEVALATEFTGAVKLFGATVADVATGSGTTSTGAYIQFNSGLKIVFGTFDMPFNSAWSTEANVSFGITFTSPPVVIVAQVFNTSNIVVFNTDITTTGFKAGLEQMSATGTRSTKYIAIGK